MAREPGSTQKMAQTLTAEDVCAYLREHPDFLVQHAEIVDHLTPPSHDRGRGVVDLQAFMVERLRGDIRALKEQQRELITTTRANLNSQNRIHAAVLFLLDAQNFEQLIQTIATTSPAWPSNRTGWTSRTSTAPACGWSSPAASTSGSAPATWCWPPTRRATRSCSAPAPASCARRR